MGTKGKPYPTSDELLARAIWQIVGIEPDIDFSEDEMTVAYIFPKSPELEEIERNYTLGRISLEIRENELLRLKLEAKGSKNLALRRRRLR